tara:strand:- start:4900 stop:5991 length:1092 start_codon:yes stop_codon:yes gene_type:complete
MEKKILHVSGSLSAGGQERTLLNILQSFKNCNQNSYLYTINHDGGLKDHFIENSDKIFYAPFSKFKLIRIIIQIIHIVHTINKNQFQIVQFYHYGSISKFWISILFFTKAKVSYFIGNQGHDRSFWQFKHIDAIVKYIDLIIVNSLSICKSHAIDEELNRVFHLKNVLDEKVIDSVKIKDNNAHDNLINIAIVARLIPEKNHGLFLDIAKLLIENKFGVKFSIIGSGPEIENIKNMIENLGLSNHVIIYTKKTNIYDIYNDIDIFMLTSIVEGFPNALMEAMMFGIPSAATDVGGIKDIIKDNVNGFLFTSGVPHEGYNIISRLIENREHFKEISQNAYDTIRNKYHPDKIVSELINEYHEIV